MAQSAVQTAWGPYDFDLTRLLEERGTTKSQSSDVVPVEPTAMVTMSRVLASWRAADRLLSDHIEASSEREVIIAKIVELRATYQRLFAERCTRLGPQMQLEVYGWQAAISARAARAS